MSKRERLNVRPGRVEIARYMASAEVEFSRCSRIWGQEEEKDGESEV